MSNKKCVSCDKEYFHKGRALINSIIVHNFDDHQGNLSFLSDEDILRMVKDDE